MSGGRTPRERRSLSKGRMEAFSDGIFAFAATLLVLDLAVQPPGSPLDQLLHGWPSFVAYLISFLTIAAAWLGHTALTDRLKHADSIFMRLNLLLLLLVAFLPFPTRLVSDALGKPANERVFVTMYGLTLLAIRFMGFALEAYADREHLYASKSDDEQQDKEQFLPIISAYVLAILIGLALPEPAVWVYLGIAVYLIVPFREVSQLLLRRS
jgi:uncharacterized membrane protein